MNYFVWTPELSVGIDEIDREHMKWISYINALHLGIEAGKEQEVVEQLLDDVISFSGEHFEHEQELFEITDYPGTKHHKELHANYLNELKELRAKASKGYESAITYEVMLSLKKWLITHVQEVDRSYVSYVKENVRLG